MRASDLMESSAGYSIISVSTALKILTLLKSEISDSECKSGIDHIFPYGYPAVYDTIGLAAEKNQLAFVGSSPWSWGPADNNHIGHFKNNVGTQKLSRNDMIRMFEGHLKFLKTSAVTAKEPQTLAQAQKEISRLKKLLADNGISF